MNLSPRPDFPRRALLRTRLPTMHLGTRVALPDGCYGHVVGQLGELLSVDVLGPTGAGDRVLVRRDEATVID